MSGKRTGGRAWTDDEIETIQRLYEKTSNDELSELLSRTVESIKHAANKLRLKKCPIFKNAERVRVGKENMKSRYWKENHISSSRINKPGRTLTANGFNDEKLVPGGRIITHTLSDVSMRIR